MPCAYAPGAAPRRRRLLRLGAAFCITAGVAATSTGCARQESARRALSIAVIPKGTSHEFWKSVHAGAVKASRELSSADLAVNVVWKGPIREDDREQQVQVVEGFLSQGVDGIVLAHSTIALWFGRWSKHVAPASRW